MTPRTLTRKQVRQVDRRAIEHYGMSGLVLMENAGRGTVDVIERIGIDGPVVVLCGRGNNGGDGFVIARHLELRGFSVRVLLFTDPTGLSGDAEANFKILEKCGLPIEVVTETSRPEEPADNLNDADWIIDALLGTGATGDPRPPYDLAVDLPSGLDCDSGEAAHPAFRAHHTCTFVAAKPGFFAPGASEFTGKIHIVDIGVPRRLVEEVSAS